MLNVLGTYFIMCLALLYEWSVQIRFFLHEIAIDVKGNVFWMVVIETWTDCVCFSLVWKGQCYSKGLDIDPDSCDLAEY